MKNIFINKTLTAITIILMAIGITSCANTDTLKGEVYTAGQAKTVRAVNYGTILEVGKVKVQAESSGILGTVGGAVIGGLLGSTIGGGTGSDIAAAVGATVGGVAGNVAEQKISLVDGSELTIRRDDGSIFVAVQKYDPAFVPGLRVKIVGSGNSINVTPSTF